MNEESGTGSVEPDPTAEALPHPERSADEATVGAPTPDEPPTADNRTPPPWEPPPSAPAPIPPGPRRSSGVFVPHWLLFSVVGLLLLALGFAAGAAVGSDSDHAERRSESFVDFRSRHPFAADHGSPFAPTPGDRNPNDPGTGPRPTPQARVYLGVEARNSSDPVGAELGRVVASSPAARAGLRVGDVVTALDSTSIKTAAQLTKEVRSHRAGDRVSVTYTRDGSSNTVEVRLASFPQIPLPSQQ